MLNIHKLDLYYGESYTLREVSLEVSKGQCACVLGRNGVGKTTLLKALMGLEPVSNGQIEFNNQSIVSLSTEERSRAGIGYVPQGRQIFPLLTVEENLLLGPVTRGCRKIPDLVFDIFPVLSEMKHRKGGDLSGGQQQQLAIGRALAIEPEMIMLDEPTEGIQPNIVSEIAQIIDRLRGTGLTILLVEQKLPFIKKLMDSFILMDRGSVVARGDSHALNEDLVKKYLSV